MGIVARVIIVGCSLAMGLLISESLIRVVDIAPQVEVISSQKYKFSDNPKLGWEPVPLAERRTSAGGINDLGYRDLNHTVSKAPDVLRIIVIGDSIAQGTGVKDENAIFPRLLEVKLRLKGIPAEVQNFAVAGYNTQQEVETLVTKGLAYSPDIVIVAYCLNDRSFEAGRMPYAMARSALQKRAADESKSLHWLARSALFRYVYFGLLFTPTGANDEIEKRFGGVFADTVQQSFARLAELSRTHDFRVIVSVFPLFRKKKSEDFEDYAFQSEHAYIRTLSDRNGFGDVDLLETFRACAKEGRVANDVYHPNERGHRCAAETLAHEIERMRLVAPKGEGAMGRRGAAPGEERALGRHVSHRGICPGGCEPARRSDRGAAV